MPRLTLSRFACYFLFTEARLISGFIYEFAYFSAGAWRQALAKIDIVDDFGQKWARVATNRDKLYKRAIEMKVTWRRKYEAAHECLLASIVWITWHFSHIGMILLMIITIICQPWWSQYALCADISPHFYRFTCLPSLHELMRRYENASF